MAIRKETTKSSKPIYDGKIIKVSYDIADIEGHEAWREVVHHPGASAIVVVDDQGRLVMERQFRYALQEALLEIPAGKLDPGEDPLVCAKRELEEETGLKAENWVSLGTIATSPGFCNEVIHIFLASGLSKGHVHWDYDEYVELEYMTIDEVLAAMKTERLKDAKSLAAICLALPYLQGIKATK